MRHRNNEDVVITGVGPVTSVGVGALALWKSLASGRSNISRRVLPLDSNVTAELPLAAMPAASDLPGLEAHMTFLAQQQCGSARDLGYALWAIELALADAGLEYDRASNNVGMVQVFEAPGVESTVGRLLELLGTPPPAGKPPAPPPIYDLLAASFYNMQPFVYVHLAGKAFGMRGFCTSVHNACSSGAFAIETAARAICSGQADVMIVVGGEAFDTAVRLEWFRRLDLYARDGLMRPFDAEPSGFFVGEGAGAIVMESASHAASRGASPYATYLGGAFAHQAWKQTIPDIRARRLTGVIVKALDRTGVSFGEVDLVVPHGAATSLSDKYEASCLQEAVADPQSPTHNHESAICNPQSDAVATVFKPYVGHMLAASGIIEMICSLLSMKHQAVPAAPHPPLNPLRLPVPLVTTMTERRVNTILHLSTGFTGHDAALLLRRV